MASSTVACVRLCNQGHIDGFHSEQRAFFFDDATRLVLVPRNGKVEAYDLPTEDGFDPRLNRKCWEVNVESLDQYLAVHISLDKRTVAVHRSNKIIQFVDRETGNLFLQGCSSQKREILGMLFVESAEYDLVMVTDYGIELYVFTSEKREGLRMVDRLRNTVKWYLYTYATRVLLLGTGQIGSRVTGYQFTASQMIKLPFVDLEPEAAPIVDAETLMEANTKPRTSLTPITASDIFLLRLYNRVFFCHKEKTRKQLRFYLIFMDTMMLAREYEMLNAALHFNVVDNVLLVHYTDSSVVAIYDLAAPSSHPIGSPLPVSGETFSGPGKRVSSSELSDLRPASATHPVRLQNIKSFNFEWRFFQPDITIDENGNIYRFQLDLEGVVTSYSDPAPLVGFLNRRRVSFVSSAHPRALLISSLRSIIHQRYSIRVMRDVFHMLHYDGSETVYPSENDRITPSALKLQTPMLKPKDVVSEVFKFVFMEDVVDASHLEMCLIEYMRAADKKKIILDQSIYIIWADILIKQKRFFQLQQMLGGLKEAQNSAVGLHLERIGGQGVYVDLGSETLGRCAVRQSKWNDSESMTQYCHALLRNGKPIKAMRVAQRHRLTTIKANHFFEAAVATSNDEVITAVKRFITEQNIL